MRTSKGTTMARDDEEMNLGPAFNMALLLVPMVKKLVALELRPDDLGLAEGLVQAADLVYEVIRKVYERKPELTFDESLVLTTAWGNVRLTRDKVESIRRQLRG